MLARIYSSMMTGIDASVVEVEADIVYGLPMFTIVGLPDAAVRESRERVRAALRNEPRRFQTMTDALKHVSTVMDIPMSRWIKNSAVLKDALYQKRIDDGWA